MSLGFDDPVSAQYIGFALHIMTGMAAGNVFGQISLFWSKIAPYNSKEGIVKGMVIGNSIMDNIICSTCNLRNTTTT